MYQTLIQKDPKLELLQERLANGFRVRWEKAHPAPLDRLQEIEIYRYYREYDSDRGSVSQPTLMYSYRQRVL